MDPADAYSADPVLETRGPDLLVQQIEPEFERA